MSRIKISKGDIFRVDVGNDKIKFFQFVMLDPAQMNSEVIRVFDFEIHKSDEFEIESIIEKEIDFYVHVVIKWGIDMGLWSKVGNFSIENDIILPYFRDVVPIDKYLGENGKIMFCETNDWVAWQLGQSFTNRKPIGKLSEETKEFFIGIIMSPIDVRDYIKNSIYSQPYFT